jgi:hypothetical protein
MTSLTFAQARALAVELLADSYKAKFPDELLIAESTGRDLRGSWAVFLALAKADQTIVRLVGAPVVLVAKRDGQVSFGQIPPDFEILDAPLVVDEGS